MSYGNFLDGMNEWAEQVDPALHIGDEVWLSGLLEPRWLTVIGVYRDTHVLVEMNGPGRDERWWTTSRIERARRGDADLSGQWLARSPIPPMPPGVECQP